MENRPCSTWWYVLSVLSAPFLLLAQTGVFGPNAKQESDTAIADLGSFGRVVLPVAATVFLGVIIGALIVLVM